MDLPTYTSIWRIEKRLYKLYDFRLPMPLPIGQVTVFVAIGVPYVVLLTIAGVPFNHTLIWLYLLPPGLATWLVTRPVLESKRLPELVRSQLRYLAEPRVLCRLAPMAERETVIVTGRVWRPRANRKAAAALAQAATETATETATGAPAAPDPLLAGQPAAELPPAGLPDPVLPDSGEPARPARRRLGPGRSRARNRPAGEQAYQETAHAPDPGALPTWVAGGPVQAGAGPAGQSMEHPYPESLIDAPSTGSEHDQVAAGTAAAADEPLVATLGAPTIPGRLVARGPRHESPPHGMVAGTRSMEHPPAFSGVNVPSTEREGDQLTAGSAAAASGPAALPPDPAAARPDPAASPSPGRHAALDSPPAAEPVSSGAESLSPDPGSGSPGAGPDFAAAGSGSPDGGAPAGSPAVLAAVPPVAAGPQDEPPAATGRQAGSPAATGRQAGSPAATGRQAGSPAATGSAAEPPAVAGPSPRRPVVTVVSGGARGPAPTVERALAGPAARRGDSHAGPVTVVPGGHRPGKPDLLQRDRARAQLPVASPARVVVLGCTVGAGQTVTTLLTAEVLASLRSGRVAAMDFNPGPASLARRAGARPALSQAALVAPSRLVIPPPHAAAGDPAQPRRPDPGADAAAFADAGDRYEIVLADPATASVPRLLAIADQLVLVAPASGAAPGAIAMTFEWLDAHEQGALAGRAIMVLNGVSRRTVAFVEQSERVCAGRCRAIVRVPWDDQVRGHQVTRTRPAAVAPQARQPRGDQPSGDQPRGDQPRGDQHWTGVLSPAAAGAYTALAGVLVSSLSGRHPGPGQPRQPAPAGQGRR